MKTNNIMLWFIKGRSFYNAKLVRPFCTFSGLYKYILSHGGVISAEVIYDYLGKNADTEVRELVEMELCDRYDLEY